VHVNVIAMTAYQQMQPMERQLLVGKIVDLLVYDPEFCSQMIDVVHEKEQQGGIKGRFLTEAFAEQPEINNQ
jgi:hypothetical protein